jgi:hexokinase
MIQMGKGFQTTKNTPTNNIRTLFHDAFARANLKLTMTTLMNDTEATLLTHAYTHPEQQHTFSIILGTGLNSAITVPVSSLPDRKFGRRPESWKKVAKHVLLNTELSMFGKNFLFPSTGVDKELDEAQMLPGFQPLEQLTSGRYIGEIVRRHAVKLAERGVLFRECFMTQGWKKPFALETPLAIMFETGVSVEEAKANFANTGFGDVDFTEEDLRVLGALVRAVTQRAAVYTAIAIWTLWKMQKDVVEGDGGVVGVAYTGAVLEKHVGVRDRCQQVLDQLADSESSRWRLVLEEAKEAGLVGAAVGALVGVDCVKEMGGVDEEMGLFGIDYGC